VKHQTNGYIINFQIVYIYKLINFDEISFSFFKKIFIRIKNQIKSKSSTFTKSILFYPIVFSVISFLGFLLTSRIDESFSNEFSIDTPFLTSIIFTGSADSARSILSAIAGGWTTILGVAFSITLVTLQLSTSRYTSHLVNKFEEDRINKLTLGWFISVVLYSLLVLKSVRTEEGDTGIFIPIVGVNVAISIALIGLFIFALFLSNISSYLKPKILVSKLVSQITYSIQSHGKRTVDTELLQEIYEQELPVERRKKILKIKAKEDGILRYIDWNTISSSLKETFKNSTKTDISLEFLKSIGDWIETGNTLVIVSETNNTEKIEEQDIEFSLTDKDSLQDNKIQKENNRMKYKKNIISDFQNQILSSIDINKDRDISKDPIFGIELLRNLAIKSAKKNDIDIANSCITGLFKILIFLLKGHDIFGLPFRIKINSNNINKTDTKEKLKNKNNNHINNYNDKTAITFSSSKKDTNTIIITIKPKEERLTNLILSDLSIINNMANTAENIPVIKHILSEYISFSKTLLEKEKNDEFYLITNWYSKMLFLTSYKSLPKEFYHELFIVSLLNFQQDLLKNYPHIKNGFDIYMKDILHK
jgi:uncharacterized membrane protein